LNQESKENYLRLSADCLFRKATTLFGEFWVAVILSGLVRDRSQGARNIKVSGGGADFVEDPKASAVPYMPQAAIDSKVADEILPLNMLGEVVMDQAHHLNEELTRRKNEE
jgi:chemotaxis response regulator CheB